MMRETLGDRLDAVLRTLLLQQEGGVSNFDPKPGRGRGGHGAHGDPSRKPSGNARPLVQQWAERFERMVQSAEIDAGIRPAEEGVSRQELRSRLGEKIREYEGYDPVEVAFWERCSIDTVVRARADRGLRRSDGRRPASREKPQTAPPRDGLKLLADVVGGEL